MKQNLMLEIFNELDMIRIQLRLTRFAILNSTEDLQEDTVVPIFDDIEKRCSHIGDKVEKIGGNLLEL